MLKLMCGQLYPSSGTIFLDRLNIRELHAGAPAFLEDILVMFRRYLPLNAKKRSARMCWKPLSLT